MTPAASGVIPEHGVQRQVSGIQEKDWIPAFAGMTM